MCRIGIVQTNPLYTFDICHLLYQFSDVLFAVDVDTIIGQFLGNDLKLLCSLADQPAHLVEDFIHRTTLMTTCYNRNGTVGTMAVATFGNLQIGIVARRGDMAMALFQIFKSLLILKVSQQLLIIELTIPSVNLGNFLLQISQITL